MGKGIADQDEFWVRIKRIQEGQVDDYDVVEVRSVEQMKDPEKYGVGSDNMKDLVGLRQELIENDEYITMIKSVEIRIMQIQREEDFDTPRNRRCVVNRRSYEC